MRFDIFRQPKAKGGIWARMSEHFWRYLYSAEKIWFLQTSGLSNDQFNRKIHISRVGDHLRTSIN